MSISLFTAMLATGCAFDEQLPEVDLQGTVRLPAEVSQFLYNDDPDLEAEPVTIDDARGIGPVYLGVFPSIQEGLYDYPHPEIGPILNDSVEGNTYPLGGTSIGRFDWACYQQLRCKVLTGRFKTYEDIIDYFANTLSDPLEDFVGDPVTGGTAFQEQCFEVLYMTGDYENLFVGEENIDFTLNGDYYEAEVEIPHVIFDKDENPDLQVSVWGWVDMPSITYEFASCDADVGQNQNYYNQTFFVGTNPLDLLNFPGSYIDSGDWVVEDPAIISNPDENFTLDIGFHYVVDDE